MRSEPAYAVHIEDAHSVALITILIVAVVSKKLSDSSRRFEGQLHWTVASCLSCLNTSKQTAQDP